MRTRVFLVTVFACFLSSLSVAGDVVEWGKPIEEMTLEELMDLPVSVTSPTQPMPTRKVPGIVSVITREEIRQSGARGLMETLSLFVPGFDFGVDVQGAVGIGVRGVWGHEGKVLLLLDGHEMNELDYSTLQFGNHFPLDQVERIEVVRGPGSVIYGGFAELAVIHVHTRSPDEFHGLDATASFGRMERATGHAKGSLLVATPVEGVEGMDVSVGAYFGLGTRSDRKYADQVGRSYHMAGSSALDPRILHATLRFRGLQVRFLMDQYHMTTRDGFGDVQARAYDQTFSSYFTDIRYAWRASDGVTLTPRFTFKHQVPWRVTDRDAETFCNRHNQRYTGGLTASWDVLEGLNLLAAVEGYAEHHALEDTAMIGLHRPYSNGGTSVSYSDVAAYSEVSWQNPIANVSAGVRYEHHSQAGGALVSRVAVTRRADWFHVKALFAQAFRTPSVQNLAIAPDLDPERATVAQLELGARIGGHVFLTASGFYTLLKNPIIFRSSVEDGKAVETYSNYRRTGSLGGEATLQARHPRFWLNLSYSYYSPRVLNRVPIYEVPGRDDLLLAFPAHKVALVGAVHLTRGLSVSPSLTFSSERFGVVSRDPQGRAVARRFAPSLHANLFVSYHDLGLKGLEIGFGVFNLTNAPTWFIQPYDGGHPPLPGPSREFLGRVSYTWEFP